ncbi:hypothetical protein MJ1_0523 [Nanobdella aerobiophila]|uniref:DUF63 family protein n=1 Tax=Nanobdella aerobiophila TaxID=2586965 RepID=A0A915SL09_9ARCH|nr:DUF63 family protein [Nanobdella aerobiophila]BBL45676.1 hypothetical protein MJ1_0523 [Nanobdella aerobiophila]
MDLGSFFYIYFIYPVVDFQYRYNIYNTTAYGLLFFIIFYIFYKFFIEKGKIKIDKDLVISIVLLTIAFMIPRVDMDLLYIPRTYLLLTPILEFWMILAFLPYLFIKNKKYYIYLLIIIILIEIPIFILKDPINVVPLLFLSFLMPFLFYFSNNENFFILSIYGEIYESIFSILSVFLFNLKSEHPLLNLIVYNMNNPLLFYSLKLLLTIITAFYIRYFVKDIKLKNTLYIMLFYLGFLPGIRASLLDLIL